VAPPARLLAYLRAHDVEAEIVAPGVPMPTVPAAAAAIGVREAQILKSLLFAGRDGCLVLAIACGPARISRERLARVAGLERPRLAHPDVVLAATGYPAGGVPPIAHATPLPVVMDRRAAALDVAYGGAGAEEFLLRIRPADILRLTGGIVADLVGEDGGDS